MADAGNNFNVIVRIGRDPELKASQKGTMFCKFSAAFNTGFGDNKSTTWLSCTVFGKSAERAQEWLHKGQQVALVGSISLREYEVDGAKKYSLDMIVDDFKPLGPKEERAAQAPAAGKPAAGDYDDDLPPF